MKKISLNPKMVTIVLLLALILPLSAFSQMMDMPMKEHLGGHGRMMEMGPMDKSGEMMDMCMENAERLGLSDEQIMKMKLKHSDMQKNQARYIADVKIAEIELSDIMDVKDFNLENGRVAVKKINEIKTAHQLEILKAMKEMRTILSDEQYVEMKKMMSMKRGEMVPDKMMMDHR